MSIATKKGDGGTTCLMYQRRVPKSHPRIEACGAVDELNSALGLARSMAGAGFVNDTILQVQPDLVALMGELATLEEDRARYTADGYGCVTPKLTAKLDRWVEELEAQNVPFKGWATPGASPAAAALDLARSTCRRAERRVCALQESGQLNNPEVLVYLNRLSDVLWLMARWAENR